MLYAIGINLRNGTYWVTLYLRETYKGRPVATQNAKPFAVLNDAMAWAKTQATMLEEAMSA